ncbi:MAG: gluconate 2-dehydrogenase subunit 3 family protein [Myxococcota bacterium]
MAMNIYIPPPGHSRRSFLRRGLVGGALLALGGGGFLASRRTALVPLPVEGLLVLDATEYAVVHALATRFIVPQEGWPTIADVGVPLAVDRLLALAPTDARAELRQLLGLFENALPNFLFGARTRPFTQMAAEEQDQVLAEWRDSAVTLRRTGFTALRSLVLAGYYGSSKVHQAVGYPGPPQGFHQPDAPVWKGGGERVGEDGP